MGKGSSGSSPISSELRRPAGAVGGVPATDPSPEQATEDQGENPPNHFDRAG